MHPNPWMPPSTGVSTSNVPSAPSMAANLNPEAEAFFPTEVMTADAEEELDRVEREGLAGHDQSHPGPQPQASQPMAPLQATPSTAELLKQAARRWNSYMFFSKREVFTCDAESEDEGWTQRTKRMRPCPKILRAGAMARSCW
ncbi:hypothetical protein FB451DRAFT_1558710 [Mycena latifolia]|nr:hypothetical protein FB451DRAFT_1377522 [Mycena latifolia]KAJ7473522.1 hypothetical protein FB451DRAFT_1558710 [Mycena latifolia]